MRTSLSSAAAVAGRLAVTAAAGRRHAKAEQRHDGRQRQENLFHVLSPE